MIDARTASSKYISCHFIYIERPTLFLLQIIPGIVRTALLSIVPLTLIVMSASPANSQLAPEASGIAATGDIPLVVVPDLADIDTKPGAAQPGALLSQEETLRRELAAVRAQLTKQAEDLEEQQRTEEALAHSLETAQRVIENLKVAASLWDSAKGAAPKADPSMDASHASAQAALEDEHRKVEALQQQLAAAHQTMDALKTGANQQASQASVMQQVERKVEALEHDLTMARQTIDGLRKDGNLAVAERADAVKHRRLAEAASQQAGQALEVQRKRADSAEHELALVRQERDALKQASTKLGAALDQEREKATGLARSLSAARETIETAKDKRRTATSQRALKARTPAGGTTSALSGSVVEPVRKSRPQKKQKAKYRKSPQPGVLAVELPAPLLPTRPPN